MRVAFGHGSAELADEQPATLGIVRVLPSEFVTAYVPRVKRESERKKKKSHTISQVLVACRRSPQITRSRARMERQSLSKLVTKG